MKQQSNKPIIALYFICVISAVIITCSMAKLVLDKYYKPEEDYTYYYLKK